MGTDEEVLLDLIEMGAAGKESRLRGEGRRGGREAACRREAQGCGRGDRWAALGSEETRAGGRRRVAGRGAGGGRGGGEAVCRRAEKRREQMAAEGTRRRTS
uniref:Uncharacterized protein n=1 Tax=Oryza brachyantha TaxID=4533 RepID=J3LE08_ORYBR